jgi:hypothetical protein
MMLDMAQNTEAPVGPLFVLICGAIVSAALTAFTVFADAPTWVLYAVLWIGGTVTSIGTIGCGVLLGNLSSSWIVNNRKP